MSTQNSNQKKYHSIVGRRTFMKMLGMGAGAAVGFGSIDKKLAFAGFLAR